MSLSFIRASLYAVVLSVVALGSAHAELKIATVNFPRLMDESVQGKAVIQSLQEEFSPRERDLRQRQKDLQAKQDKLNRDGAVMAEKERAALEKDLGKNQRDFQADGEAFSEEFGNRRNEESNKLQSFLVTEVQGYAKTNGYDLVLPGHMVVFVKDALDITNQVLTYLQSRPMAAPAAPAKAPTKPAK